MFRRGPEHRRQVPDDKLLDVFGLGPGGIYTISLSVTDPATMLRTNAVYLNLVHQGKSKMHNSNISWEEDRMGMRILSEVVEITKDPKGLVGISIGGGHPYCPCVYVVQIFDNSPAAEDGRIRSGDEVVAINGQSVKGDKKTHVAQMIQSSPNPVKITVNKLDTGDASKGKTLDIVLKKVKHKVVEFMEADTADALGLSRAILCNDPLLKKMRVLEENATLYRTLIEYFNDLLHAQENINKFQKMFGDAFCELAAHESQGNASEAFTVFGECHRQLEKRQNDGVKALRPLISDLVTYVEKAVPDTELTLKKYLDVKYEYLSYCLKLKELDDEEIEFHSMGDSLYRVETGNYEYRLMLRSRQETRQKFINMRNDVMVKIELLDQKHVRDIAMQLTNMANVLKGCQLECAQILEKTVNTPIEIDLSQVGVKYNTSGRLDSTDDVDIAEEAVEDAKEEPTQEVDLFVVDDEPSTSNHEDLLGIIDQQPSTSNTSNGLLDLSPGTFPNMFPELATPNAKHSHSEATPSFPDVFAELQNNNSNTVASNTISLQDQDSSEPLLTSDLVSLPQPAINNVNQTIRDLNLLDLD